MGKSTHELTEELRNRKGISTIDIAAYENIKITADHQELQLTGPAIILINQD